ncbi:ATP-binding protein [Streptomyces sp. NPDC048436]|uniref:ATP-binding protein n=1 Tax=Streptomyces sp. NPDC048436 TaxID=3365550 RepID=UPI003713F9D9
MPQETDEGESRGDPDAGLPPDTGSTPDTGSAETTIVLDGEGTCIAEARHLAVLFLAQAQARLGFTAAERAVDLMQLVVSELVTNARKYAPGPIRLRLRIAGGAVEIAVWDSAAALPMARAADPERVGQHGLEIVKAIAQELTVQPEPSGKRITALVSLEPERPSDLLTRPVR